MSRERVWSIGTSDEFFDSLTAFSSGSRTAMDWGYRYEGRASGADYLLDRHILAPGFEATVQRYRLTGDFVFPFIARYEGLEISCFYADREMAALERASCRLTFMKDARKPIRDRYAAAPGDYFAFNVYMEKQRLHDHLDVRSLFPFVDRGEAMPVGPEPLELLRRVPVGPGLRGLSGNALRVFLHGAALQLFAAVSDALIGASSGAEAASRMRDAEFRAMATVRERLEREYARPPTIERLAADAGMSPRTLTRSFKKAYGTSVYAVVMACRMDRALFCLRELGMSVTDTALEVGYDHLSHFIEAFRRLYGLSPGEVKRRRERYGG